MRDNRKWVVQNLLYMCAGGPGTKAVIAHGVQEIKQLQVNRKQTRISLIKLLTLPSNCHSQSIRRRHSEPPTPIRRWFLGTCWPITRHAHVYSSANLHWPIDFRTSGRNKTHTRVCDLSRIDSIVRFKQPVFLFAVSSEAQETCSQPPPETSAQRAGQPTTHVWRTWSAAGCGEACMLLLLVLSLRYASPTQHWPTGGC